MKRWYFYEMFPIDDLWEMLATPEETVKKILAGEGGIMDVVVFVNDYAYALDEARKRGWEGDFRHPARVFWLPGDTIFVYAFVWKQDNNGATFVVSPYELPWLKDYSATCEHFVQTVSSWLTPVGSP